MKQLNLRQLSAKFLTTTLLFLFTLGFSQSAWAEENFKEVYMTYSYNGESSHYTYKSSDKDHATVALGTLTANFVINSIYMKYTDNWGTGRGDNPNGQMCYKINSGSTKYFGKDTWTKTWGDPYELQNSSCNLTIGNIEGASGNYTFEHWYQMWWNSTNKYVNNDGANYKFTYTILPPAATNLTVTPSGDDIKSGTGTESDPLILVGNGSFTLTAVASKERTDDNSNVNIKFGDGSYSLTTTKTISNVTNTEVQSIDIKACCINGSLMGAESSTTTIYYKVEPAYTITVVSENVNKGTVDKASVTAYQYGQADNSITATPKAGFDFAAWTKSVAGITVNSPSNATTTLKASEEGTVTATFAYKTPSVSHAGTATFQIGGAAIKLNPTYTDVAADATYAWECRAASGTGAAIDKVTFSATNIANPNVSASVAGTYTIRVTVTQGGVSAYKDITLTASAYSGADCGTCFGHTAQ